MTDETPAVPEIVWPEDGSPVTGPDGRRWQLLTHSTRNWHLYEVDERGRRYPYGRYLGETDAGRWPQHARRRAQRVAAYLITHPEAEHRRLDEIRAAALGEEYR